MLERRFLHGDFHTKSLIFVQQFSSKRQASNLLRQTSFCTHITAEGQTAAWLTAREGAAFA
jgi:hypothetical protein